jgi:hypothetical protein
VQPCHPLCSFKRTAGCTKQHVVCLSCVLQESECFQIDMNQVCSTLQFFASSIRILLRIAASARSSSNRGRLFTAYTTSPAVCRRGGSTMQLLHRICLLLFAAIAQSYVFSRPTSWTATDIVPASLPTSASHRPADIRQARQVLATDAPFETSPSPSGAQSEDTSPIPTPDTATGFGPDITAAPVGDTPPGSGMGGTVDGYVQETYYTCITIGAQGHCGWHEPIVKAETSNAGVARVAGLGVLQAVGVAAMLAMLLFCRWI